ncbi:hypothetical protein E2P81_ATG00629 [Venturia nashicola]|nr:hypothetical protein E2P81_ATG00629 [Venturia nashicola]
MHLPTLFAAASCLFSVTSALKRGCCDAGYHGVWKNEETSQCCLGDSVKGETSLNEFDFFTNYGRIACTHDGKVKDNFMKCCKDKGAALNPPAFNPHVGVDGYSFPATSVLPLK